MKLYTEKITINISLEMKTFLELQDEGMSEWIRKAIRDRILNELENDSN